MTFKWKKSQIWPFRPWKITFRAIQPNLSFDMWFMSPQRSFMPKKRKSYWSVSEIDPSPPSILTDGRTDRRTDRQTDRQTDRRTTDKSVLEKLRCLSAGGAKNKRPVGLIAPPFIISFLATGNWPKIKWKPLREWVLCEIASFSDCIIDIDYNMSMSMVKNTVNLVVKHQMKSVQWVEYYLL